MAIRGPKPKPHHLHVVDGTLNATRHAGGDALSGPIPEDHVPLERPKHLRAKSKAARLWDEASALCWWLEEADAYKLGMWCALQAEFEKSPSGMTAARIGQLRALGSELGFDPASRARLGGATSGKKSEKEGNGKYFD